MRESLNILIVDDYTAHRCVLRIMLQEWGYATEEAVDGGNAVKLCREQPFDLVLMDVHMPKKTGLEALNEIKLYKPDLPVIIMTACSDIEISIGAIKSGADSYLSKPIDFEKLKVVLRDLLAHAGMQ